MPTGLVIARSARLPTLTSRQSGPIRHHLRRRQRRMRLGDFSRPSYTMTDFVEVTTRTVECMNDLGFSVTVIPPGDGISYANVPPEQNASAIAQSEECRRSMSVT